MWDKVAVSSSLLLFLFIPMQGSGYSFLLAPTPNYVWTEVAVAAFVVIWIYINPFSVPIMLEEQDHTELYSCLFCKDKPYWKIRIWLCLILYPISLWYFLLMCLFSMKNFGIISVSSKIVASHILRKHFSSVSYFW